MNNKNNKNNKKNVYWLTSIILSILIIFYFMYISNSSKPEEKDYTEFVEELEKGEVHEVLINLRESNFLYALKTEEIKKYEKKIKEEKKKEKEKKEEVGTVKEIDKIKAQNLVYFKTSNPRTDDFKKILLESNVKVKDITSNSSGFTFLSFLQILVFGLLVYILLKSMNVGNMIIKSTDKKETKKLSFNDIAGNEEAKEEMHYLVDFLKNKEKYINNGAKLPKGCIFYGPPGTGKTMLAKVVADEADVPFFFASGSDFVEKYVGVGASRVRKLFKEAKKNAPAIVFIDEIDAIGGQRGMDGNSEKEQTINALLTELDGFEGDEGVIIIAATNRLDMLDTALIRPGRFDKHIAIGLPEEKDRKKILEVYCRNKKIHPDVDFSTLAKTTVGLAGADLEAIMNEAAIMSTINNHEKIMQEDVDNAFYKMIMKSSPVKNQKDRKLKELEIVAWHEAGHALLAKAFTSNAVPKVTIVSSTNGAGGVTFVIPTNNTLVSKEELEGNIITLYGGRVAEYLLHNKNSNKVTTGASQDIRQANKSIKHYINDYGMSESFGMLSPSDFDSVAILDEAKKLSHQFYQEALTYLEKNRDLLEATAHLLLEKETITEQELDDIISSHKKEYEEQN